MHHSTPSRSSAGNMILWVGIAVVIILAGGAFFLMNNNDPVEEIAEVETNLAGDPAIEDIEFPSDTAPDTPTTTDTSNEQVTDDSVKVIEITGQNFGFSQEEIRVNQGDTVRIVFSATEGLHDWVVDEFNAATEQVTPGTTTEVEFVADQAGTFEYYCSVGNHREMGMVGNLIVE